MHIMKQYLCSRRDCQKGNHNCHLQGAAAPRLWGCSACAPDLGSLTKAKNWKSLFFVPDLIMLATKPSILNYPCKVFFWRDMVSSFVTISSSVQCGVTFPKESNSPQRCPNQLYDQEKELDRVTYQSESHVPSPSLSSLLSSCSLSLMIEISQVK